MDVNGTRFHLVQGRADWERLRDINAGSTWRRAAWDPDRESVTLRPLVERFVAPRRDGEAPSQLDPARRSGAAADRFGTIYWIGADRRSLLRLRPGRRRAEPFWTAEEPECDPPPEAGGDGFEPAGLPPARTVRLSGLTVTGHHYLIVGNPPERELLAFDLHAGGAPVRLGWPTGPGAASIPFAPFDLDPAPDDGFWVLDRATRGYWLVNRVLQVNPLAEQLREVVEEWAPSDVEPPIPGGAREFPHPIALPGVEDPIAIAGLPDGTVLILDSPPGGGLSRIVRFRGGEEIGRYPIPGSDLEDDEALVVRGFDLAYVPGVRPAAGGHVYVVESEGNQAFRYRLDLEGEPFLAPDPVYLPMRRYGGAELVVRSGRALYDFLQRWVELRPIHRPRFEQTATLETPTLDGLEHDCAWHRVLVDACIPPGTAVEVDVRAANTALELRNELWRRHPGPYRRGDGSEIPGHRPYGAEPPPNHGTFETLMQEVTGRFAQVRIRLLGTGRATPAVRALRIHYPRFSYLERYLPAIYREERTSASFTERMLANFEGMLTTWEGRIATIHRFFSPEAVPPEALEWLAGWLGIVFDPLWDEPRRRLFLRHAADFYRLRGTPRGIELAVRLFLDAEPDDRLFDAARRGRSPVRIVERFRIRQTSGATQGMEDRDRDADVLDPLTLRAVRAAAHRFVVLLPAGLDAGRVEIVRRIVEVERPAHTEFDVRAYWALFRVGAARLGIDSELGEGLRFHPVLLGASHLGTDTHLASPHPFDVEERNVLDRDRLGAAPPL